MSALTESVIPQASALLDLDEQWVALIKDMGTYAANQPDDGPEYAQERQEWLKLVDDAQVSGII